MNDYVNATKCVAEEQRRETAKELLDSMESTLRTMEDEVDMLADAVYRGGKKEPANEPANEPCVATPPMVVVMRKQRDTAEHLLKEIMQIREALW